MSQVQTRQNVALLISLFLAFIGCVVVAVPILSPLGDPVPLILIGSGVTVLALGLFLKDESAIAIGVHLNAIVVWSFSFFGVSMVLSGVVRSTGAVVPPLLILFFSLWGLRITFAWLLMPRWQADAIWWSFPIASVAAMTLSIAYYRLGAWRKAQMLR